MSLDYYKLAKEISSSLIEIGLCSYALELNNVINFGSTSAEILMGIRYWLTKLNETESLPNDLKKKSNKLIKEIGAVLNN